MPKQQTGMIMSLYTKSFTIWLLATHSALAHEFWIEPRTYTFPSQATIEADLLVGSEFVGQDYIFIPKGYSSALFSRNLYNFLSAYWDEEAKRPVLPDDDEVTIGIRL